MIGKGVREMSETCWVKEMMLRIAGVISVSLGCLIYVGGITVV